MRLLIQGLTMRATNIDIFLENMRLLPWKLPPKESHVLACGCMFRAMSSKISNSIRTNWKEFYKPTFLSFFILPNAYHSLPFFRRARPGGIIIWRVSFPVFFRLHSSEIFLKNKQIAFSVKIFIDYLHGINVSFSVIFFEIDENVFVIKNCTQICLFSMLSICIVYSFCQSL